MKQYEEKIGYVTWIHFRNPNQKDLTETAALIPAHPLILKELSTASDRSKIESYHHYLFAVYHLPIYDEGEKMSKRTEIDFLASRDIVLTYSYEDIGPITQLKSHLKEKLNGKARDASQVIYHLLQEINTYSLRELRHVEEKVNAVGRKLFNHSDRKLLEELSYIKRDLFEFSLIAASQKSTLESLLLVGGELYGEKSRAYFSDLLGSFSRVHYLLETLRMTVISYSETVSQIFQSETSEVVKRFSILGFLTFPLLLYATITLQPNFAVPLSMFWIWFAIITIVVAILAVIFRRKKWF